MAKRGGLEVRVSLQKQQLKNVLGVSEKPCLLRIQGAEVSPRGSVWEMGQMLSLLFLKLFDTLSFYFSHPFVKYATIIIYHWKGSWLENQDTWFLLLALLWNSYVTLVSLGPTLGLSSIFWNQGPGRIVSRHNVLRLHLLSLRYGHWVAFGPLFFPSMVSVSNAQARHPTLRTLSSSQGPRRGFSQI